MTRTAADVEQEVVAQRGQLDRTVEALKDKMTPGQIFDEASRAMGGAGQEVMAKFMEQAKENPMPLAVMGLGLAWLMTSSRRSSQGSGYGSAAASYQQGERGIARRAIGEGIADTARDFGDNAAHLASDAAHYAADALSKANHTVAGVAAGVGGVGHEAAHSVMSAAGAAGDLGRRARDGLVDLFQNEPLVLGAAGLFVGLAVGAVLPATPVENRLVGAMRDRTLERGASLAHDTLSHAGQAAQAAVVAATHELSAGDVSGAVGNAAHAGAEAAREALRNGA